MATGYSPRIVTDGLVLALDAGNTKSFRGEPTTNLLSQPTSINNWSTQQATVDATPAFVREIDGNLIPFYKVTSTVITDPFINLSTAVGNISNRTFTYSVYLFTDPGQPTTSIQLYTYGNVPSFEGSSVTSATLTITSTPTRYKLTSTYGAGFNSTSLANRVDLNSSTLGYLYVGGAQLEEKSYETRFVVGARGTTVATGGGWADRSGGSRHGELVNGPTYNSSNLGSLVFDGVNDYISFANSYWATVFNNTVGNNFTLRCIVQPKNIGVAQALISQRHGDAMSLYLMENGKVTLEMDDTNTRVGTTTTLQNNNWYDITVTFVNNTSQSRVYYYVNGQFERDELKWDSNGIDITNNLWIGWQSRDNYGINPTYFNGDISLVQIYNRALTAAEVLQNYNATKGRYGV